MEEIRVLDFNGDLMSPAFLSLILNVLNAEGAITVKGVAKGSVNSLQIGATLAKRADPEAKMWPNG